MPKVLRVCAMKITAALLLAVSLIRLTSAQPLAPASPAAPAGKPGTVDGLVTNSVTGDPLRKAVVTLQGVASLGDLEGSSVEVMTDAAGRFHFDKIAPGTYLINATRDGFTAVRQRHAKTVKVGEEENVKDVTVALQPLARVSGHVLDEDGDPIMLASVQALRYGFNQGRKQLTLGVVVTSNDLGEFQFSGLEPGRYFFIANARPPVQNLPPRTRFAGQLSAYPPTFYPSAIDAAQATASELVPGATVSNIDFRLRKVPAFHVRGKLLDAAGQPARDGFLNLFDDAGSLRSSRGAARIGDDGLFDFPAVVPGPHSLVAFRNRPSGQASEYVNDQITVADQDVNGLNLMMSTGVTINGRFSVEGPQPPQFNGQVNIRPTDGFGQGASAVVQQDGTFAMENVHPGSYMLDIYSMAPGLYVKSIRFGDTDLSSGELAITRGSVGQLNIVMGTDGAQIQGTIQTSGTTLTSAVLSLVPSGDLPWRQDLVKQTGTDAQGNFKFQDVAPGEYKVYAWQEMVPDVIDVPEFRKALESRAASVTVQPGGHESVQVQVIPADDVEAEKNKLQ